MGYQLDDLLQAAKSLLAGGQWAQALATCEHALRLATSPRDAAASLIGQGRAHLNLGALGKAIETFRAARERDSRSWEPVYWEGCAHGWSREFAAADSLFTQALELAPDEGRIHAQRGHARFKLQRFELALSDYRAAQKFGALDSRGRLAMAEALLQTRGAAEAGTVERLACEILREHAEDRAALAVLAHAQEEQGRLTEARATDDRIARSTLREAWADIEAGRREVAIELLKAVLMRQPDQWRVAHTLGLALYFTARASPPGDDVQNRTRWEDIIATWTTVLYSRSFATEWIADAERRYRLKLPEDARDTLRRQIGAHLREVLPPGFVPFEAGRSLESAGELLVEREVRAADLLQQSGGVALGPRQLPIACGPLMIRLLEAEKPLAEFVRRVDPEVAKALRTCFSQLGFAQTLFAMGRAGEALAVLLDLRCPRCRATGRGEGETIPADDVPEVCDENCSQFERNNPAYADLRVKAGPGSPEQRTSASPACSDTSTNVSADSTAGRSLFWTDAIDLLIETHLTLAQAVFTSPSPDSTKGGRHWQTAVRISSRISSSARVRNAIEQMAVGRANALRQTQKWDAAVSMLDAAIQACGDPQGQELVGRLAEALTARGIEAGNDTPPRWEASVADLQRAVDANPHAARPLQELAVASRARSRELNDEGDSAAAVALLRDAVVRFRRAAQEMPLTPRMKDEVRGTQDGYVEALVTRADELTSLGQLETAIAECRDALDALPQVLLGGPYQDNAVIQIALIRQRRAAASRQKESQIHG